MNRVSVQEQVRAQHGKAPEKLQFSVDPRLQGCMLTVQESVTRDGTAVTANILARIPVDNGPVSLVLEPNEGIEVRHLHSVKTTVMKHIVDDGQHMDNTKLNTEGVIEMDPFEVFRREWTTSVAAGAHTKIGGGIVIGIVLTWLHYPVVDSLLWITALAIVDWLIGIYPGVHPQDVARVDTSWSRLKQWGIAILFFSGMLIAKQAISAEQASGWTGDLGSVLPNVYSGAVVLIYMSRMFNAVRKVFYGDSASSTMKLLSKFTKRGISDDKSM